MRHMLIVTKPNGHRYVMSDHGQEVFADSMLKAEQECESVRQHGNDWSKVSTRTGLLQIIPSR